MALASAGACAAEPLFSVESSQEGLTIPYVLCAEGKTAKSCYRFTAHGTKLFIMAKSPQRPSIKDAGIKLEKHKYNVEGCAPYANGYCLFSVNNMTYTKLYLVSPDRTD